MAIDFRLDRTQFSGMTFEEADKSINNFSGYDWKERLIIANHLNSIAYNYPLHNPPKIDRTFFEARNIEHGKHI